MHKEVTSKKYPVYDVNKAEKIHQKKGWTRKLSMMKQRNIKDALDGEIKLSKIRKVAHERCGYCFEYLSMVCDGCPVVIKTGQQCHSFSAYFLISEAKSKRQLRALHKSWCKKIGLDVYGKDEKTKK